MWWVRRDVRCLRFILRAVVRGRCRKSVILFATTNTLLSDSQWEPILQEISSAGLINLITINKAHHIVGPQGRDFRPELPIAAKNIACTLRSKSPQHIPLLITTSTLSTAKQKNLFRLIRSVPHLMLWGEMKRRFILLGVEVAGRPITVLESHLRSIFFQ